MPPPVRPVFVCIGWGSLVWSPGTLPCAGLWRPDGPALPVEFARESGVKDKGSRGDRITLVICPDVRRVPTFWVPLDIRDLARARKALALREYEKANGEWMEANVGYWDAISGGAHGAEANTIREWARHRGVSAAVWTNLPCGLVGARHMMPSAGDVVAFLRGLPDKGAAEEYVRKTPVEIRTDYRAAIERDLGWYHEDAKPD